MGDFKGKIVGIFPDLWKNIFLRHIQSGIIGNGHDVFHAARVAQCAFEIAETLDVARLAGVAGLCHNADRIIQYDLKVGRGAVSEELIRNLVDDWLTFTDLTGQERALVLDAVLGHDLPNDAQDNSVLVALKDADRLVNLEPDAIMRTAQFYADFPAVDPIHWLADPSATHREPKSIIRCLRSNAEWGNFSNTKFGIRLPRAQQRATELTDYLLNYIEKTHECWIKAGLLPFTPPQ